jgi:hypothetical protein
MKIVRLSLSDSAYEKALAIASGHALPVEAYIASEMEDLFNRRSQIPLKQIVTESKETASKPAAFPSTRLIMPSTLEQVLDVCTNVYVLGQMPKDENHARTKFRDAVHTVAEKWGIGETSVRDKCCSSRRLGLPDVPVTTDTFVSWLCNPELFRDHLCRKFPNCVNEIHKRFAELLPTKFGGN